MIKIFISDVDGTLLNGQGKVSLNNQKAIKLINEQHMHFILNSGRDYPMLLAAIKDFDIVCEAMCLNGAQYFDDRGQLKAAYPLDKKDIKNILAIANKLKIKRIHYFSESGRYLVCEPQLLKHQLYEDFQVMFRGEIMDNLDQFMESNQLYDICYSALTHEAIHEHDIMKIEFIFENKTQKQDAIELFKAMNTLNISSSHINNLEINAVAASKAAMAKKVCKLYNVSEDEVVVIGDSYNDISMLEAFKYSFVMGQAPEAVKKYANYQTAGIDEDGFADCVDLILNWEERND